MSGILPQKDVRRFKFVLKNIMQIIVLALTADTTHHAMLRLYPSKTPHVLPKDLTIRHSRWLHDLVNKALFGIFAFSKLQLHYVALARAAVACRHSIPEVSYVGHRKAFPELLTLTQIRNGHRFLAIWAMVSLFVAFGASPGIN